METAVKTRLSRNEAILMIRKSLRERSGKAWSVTGGRGTAWGWITICSPPARRVEFGYMTDADRAELGQLLGMGEPVHSQGETVPASSDYYQEYVDRAAGRQPSVRGQQYWD